MRVLPSTWDGAAIFGACISALAGLFALAFIGTFAIFAPLLLFPPVTSVRSGLVEVAVATAALYLVSNALQHVLRRRPGYHQDDASPLPRRQLSQPVLMAISLALGILLVAYPAWWNHRLAAREYAHARACYAQLEAVDRLPGMQATFVPGYLKLHAALYLSTAEEHGAMLGMAREDTDRDLANAAAAYFNSYSAYATARQKHSALLGDVTRCLDGDEANP